MTDVAGWCIFPGMKTFVITFLAALLGTLAAAGILHFIKTRSNISSSQKQISSEEANARELMKGLTPGEVTIVCGQPSRDYIGNYGDDYKWRILSYNGFEANFVLKKTRWQYDFASDGRGRILPDATMVKGTAIKLPCEEKR